MRAFIAQIIFIVCLCCFWGEAYGQVRIRHGIRLPKFRHRERAHHQNRHAAKKHPVTTELRTAGRTNSRDNAVDEHFFIKWNKDRKLGYKDFLYNRNQYNKFIPEQDTDLINTVYPDYLAFYANLRKRNEQEGYIPDAGSDERIERMLKLKLDSMEQGYISSATLNIDLSMTINIDSPAASVLSLTPVIYALNETTYYFNISPVFSKYESWMMVKSKDILQHEQIHFDIFELHARKMRQLLLETLKKNYNRNIVHDMSSEITPGYELLYRQLNQMQLEFDRQTGAMTQANQPLNNTNAAWTKELKAQLDLLSAYEIPEGTILLK